MSDLELYRRRIDSLLERRRQLLSSIKTEKRAVKEVANRLDSVVEAQVIVQRIAQGIQQQVHERISRVVIRCLAAVFDDPYQFSIRFDRKRGKTEAVKVFSRDGMELDEPLGEIGGGAVEVAALGMRVSAILMSRPEVRRLLVLDEPFKSVRGRGNRARTKVMLERLAEDLGLQVILNTDVQEFQLGTVVEMD